MIRVIIIFAATFLLCELTGYNDFLRAIPNQKLLPFIGPPGPIVISCIFVKLYQIFLLWIDSAELRD